MYTVMSTILGDGTILHLTEQFSNDGTILGDGTILSNGETILGD